MTATFTISEKTSQASLNLTKQEAEGIAQVFGLSALDWRRLSDAAAANWFAAILRKHGADPIYAALTRVRRLAGRERGFWLTSIAVVDPKQSPLLKNPPDWSDAELWRVAFMVFMTDELKKLLQQLNINRMEAALAEQV